MSAMSLHVAAVPSPDLSRSRIQRLQPALVFAAACFAVVLFALVPASTRIATTQLDGLSIGLIRIVGAGLASLPLLFFLRPQAPQRPQDWGLLLLYAFGNFAAFPVLFSLGVHRTSGAHAALIMAAMPLFIGLIGMVLDRRLPRSSWFIGAAIAVAGETALVAMGNGASSTGATVGGDAIVFAGCTFSAVGIVAGARLSARMKPLAAALWGITVASLAVAPWAAMRMAATAHAYQSLNGATWAAIVHITLGAAVTANVLWLWAVSRGGLVRVAPIQFAQPVCALFFASVLLNERLTASLLFVAACIVFGTITACRGARSNPVKQAGVPAHALPWSKRNAAAIAFANLPFHRAPDMTPSIAPATADAVLSARIEQVVLRCRQRAPAAMTIAGLGGSPC
jgi:drug/metabolite transporter (DMT)-like permease